LNILPLILFSRFASTCGSYRSCYSFDPTEAEIIETSPQGRSYHQ